MGFYDHIKDELLFPWIQRENQPLSIAIVKLFSYFWDLTAEDCLYILQQFHVATCDVKRLPIHGRTRRLPKRPGEADEDDRTRLIKAWYLHSLSGRLDGIQLALDEALPDIDITIRIPGVNSWRVGSGRVGSFTIGSSTGFTLMLILPAGTSAADRTTAYEAAYAVKAARDKIILQDEFTPPGAPFDYWRVGTTRIGSMSIQ